MRTPTPSLVRVSAEAMDSNYTFKERNVSGESLPLCLDICFEYNSLQVPIAFWSGYLPQTQFISREVALIQSEMFVPSDYVIHRTVTAVRFCPEPTANAKLSFTLRRLKVFSPGLRKPSRMRFISKMHNENHKKERRRVKSASKVKLQSASNYCHSLAAAPSSLFAKKHGAEPLTKYIQ